MKSFFITAFAGLALMTASCNNRNNSHSNVDQAEAMAAPADSADAATISFETNTYDFGKIKEGEKVSYGFKFTNNGKSPLIISNASASCGCTVPDYPHEPIAPGKSGAVTVVFNSAGKPGTQHKVVTLTTNAIPSTTELHVTGEVQSLTK